MNNVINIYILVDFGRQLTLHSSWQCEIADNAQQLTMPNSWLSLSLQPSQLPNHGHNTVSHLFSNLKWKYSGFERRKLLKLSLRLAEIKVAADLLHNPYLPEWWIFKLIRAGHLGFAILQCSFKSDLSYSNFVLNLIIYLTQNLPFYPIFLYDNLILNFILNLILYLISKSSIQPLSFCMTKHPYFYLDFIFYLISKYFIQPLSFYMANVILNFILNLILYLISPARSTFPGWGSPCPPLEAPLCRSSGCQPSSWPSHRCRLWSYQYYNNLKNNNNDIEKRQC